MIQSEASNGIVSPPITPTATCDSKFECNVCRKVFKSKSGLTRHHNIVKKYNISRSDLDILPENTTRQFKGILVHYIRKKLPRGYKKLGKQTVSIPATESQFYAVFKDHIHYYSARKNIYKCIFHGVSANQILADILEMQEWGVKFYEQCQRTYVVLYDDNNIESDVENPILQVTKQCKSRYERGQLVVEWKQQKNSDFNGNLTQAGYIYFHLFNSQAMIQ
ncbi:hypothetical protein RhiirA4_418455 [Rhizophagus irregularis]|uniref:C2H2-type domain-containing protein n=1 Tax=Rhizophagus irregularis TaxID=588596 RepID=A0A2I1GAS3_9GLOM|nr:hypothetical protein RhiirA4_418455 [Rhizophagus irregularis]